MFIGVVFTTDVGVTFFRSEDPRRGKESSEKETTCNLQEEFTSLTSIF